MACCIYRLICLGRILACVKTLIGRTFFSRMLKVDFESPYICLSIGLFNGAGEIVFLINSAALLIGYWFFEQGGVVTLFSAAVNSCIITGR